MNYQRLFLGPIAQMKRTGAIVLLAGVVGLGLAACGDPTPAQPTSTPLVTEGAASTPTAEIQEIETATPEVVTSEVSPTSPTSAAGGSAESTPVAESTTQAADCTLLNLNEVTQDQLMAAIPGFSSRMVREFFEYRPYVSIQQFRKEIGKYVDEAQVAEYEKYVYVPVNPNEADAATLSQLPGVDETVAATLIAARPYASNDAFVQALGTHVDVQQLAEASCYLNANS